MTADLGADIVFLTALSLEYDAIHAHLTDARSHIDPDGTRYAIGGLPGAGCRVALALIGEGNLAAAALAGRAIQDFKPRTLMLVGIAGGLTDDAAVGDVVVATRVHAYQGGREESDVFRPRPRGWPVAHGLEQLAREVAQSGAWTAPLPDATGESVPRVHFKPLVSGDVVLDSRTSPLAGLIAKYYSDAIAIDMESAGVAEAAHRKNFHQAITIRGISDAADGAKRHIDAAGWQSRAAAHAAAFAVTLAQRIEKSAPAPADLRDRLHGARTSTMHGLRALSAPRLYSAIRRGRWPAQVLSAIMVATVSVFVYIGVTSLVQDRTGPGEPGTTTSGTRDHADPVNWTTVRTGRDVTLDDWRMIDFETGDTADFDLDGVNNLPSMDLALSHDATRVYGRLSVLETPGDHAVSRCLAAERYTDSIQANLRERLTRGRDVCVRTKEDGLAMLTVDQAPNAAFVRLVFHYTVWKLR